MKKFIAIIFTILLCLNFLFSQTKREVKKQILISSDAPEICLKFDKKFNFAGSQKFILYNRAEAEQFFFVEADGKEIKRLYMLQFENFLPKIEATYNYNEPETVKIGGLNFFVNSENVSDVETALKAVPDSDIAKAAGFLKSKGFTLMKSITYQRFVRVVSDDKRREFIILYVEDAENKDAGNSKENLQIRALKNLKIQK